MIGIATSMFAALYVGRFLIEFFFGETAKFFGALVPDLKFNYLACVWCRHFVGYLDCFWSDSQSK